jgi:hypothetical protein
MMSIAIGLVSGCASTSSDRQSASSDPGANAQTKSAGGSSAPMAAVLGSEAEREDIDRLLGLLERDIATAARHIRFAARHRDVPKWVTTQLRHARHAIDAKAEPEGPGSGKGVAALATELSLRMRSRASSAGLSATQIVTANRIAACAGNLETWAKQARSATDKLLVRPTGSGTTASLEALVQLTYAMEHGLDANSDGIIKASRSEGGLSQIRAVIDGRIPKKPTVQQSTKNS